MLKTLHRKILAALAITTIATAALAATFTQVCADTASLQSDYTALYDRVLAKDGPKADRETDYLALESRRAQLHLDRDSLGACSCTTLDTAIGGVDDTASLAGAALDGWDD